MRIAFLTPTFPPYPGGIGVNAYYNAREMSKRGFAVEVFTPKYQTTKTTNYQLPTTNFPVHYLRPLFSYGKTACLPQLFWRLRHFDAVHAYYPFFGGIEIAALARCFFKFKFILHHEMDVVGQRWQKKIFSWHTRHVLPWLLKKSDLLLALSKDYLVNSDIGRLYPKKKKLPSWQVVPNGVDVDLFKPMPQEQLPTTNYQLPTVLFAAGLDRAHYFKGVPTLLLAIDILKRDNFLVQLSVAGEGELKKDYQEQVKKLGLENQVNFVGLVTHDRLPAFYRGGDLFVMPSTGRTESFSIATAEAQACGLPVVVSDLPGMRATIENGVTGLLAKPGDTRDLAEKIKTILQNPERSRQMGQAGRQRVEKMFSWEVIGEKLTIIYKELIHK